MVADAKSSKGKTKAKPAPSPTTDLAAPPNWPLLKPLLPASDLWLDTVVAAQIVVIRSFWTSTLCKNYVAFLRTLPLVTTPGEPAKGEALRVNDRLSVEDPAFARRLWVETGLRELLGGGTDGDGAEARNNTLSKEEREELWGGEVVGLNPKIRIYRYTKGQFFDCHYDESNLLTLPTSSPPPTPARTTWTLLLYLTSPATGCEGGQTVFYPAPLSGKNSPAVDKEVVVELETGMLLLHKHGDDCMLHEGREVTQGEKWVIRSDLCVRR